ncbi:MAG TPA: chorismate-binding protein, partial [Bacteroidia bacterium]|nr:chorismate-binding protein [Bacteroidia bacterium]
KYYTGYLGPYNIDGKAELFVNLRCAEVFNDSVNIYVGGGITSDSVAEKEWDETVMKSQTLLSVMFPKTKVL